MHGTVFFGTKWLFIHLFFFWLKTERYFLCYYWSKALIRSPVHIHFWHMETLFRKAGRQRNRRNGIITDLESKRVDIRLPTSVVPSSKGSTALNFSQWTSQRTYSGLCMQMRFGMNTDIITNFYSSTEPADRLCYGMVWELICLQPQNTTESGGIGTEHHRHNSLCHPGYTPQAMLRKSTQHHQGQQSSCTPTVLLVTVRQVAQGHGSTDHNFRTVFNQAIRLVRCTYFTCIVLILFFMTWYHTCTWQLWEYFHAVNTALHLYYVQY